MVNIQEIRWGTWVGTIMKPPSVKTPKPARVPELYWIRFTKCYKWLNDQHLLYDLYGSPTKCQAHIKTRWLYNLFICFCALYTKNKRYQYSLQITNVGSRLVSWDSIVRQFPKIIEYLLAFWEKNSIVRSFFSEPIFSGGALSTFIHLSLGKAGPFTLESNIHVKALKMQGFPNN